jgi:hypothetical protein
MTMLVELARRAVSHPQTATFVKRAVAIKHGQGEEVEVPTWGVVVVYLTVLVASIAFSLVSTHLQPCTILSIRPCVDNVLLGIIHAQPRYYIPLHG